MNNPATNRGKIFAVTGAMLQLGGPVIGAIGTAIGMMHAFDTLGATGPTDPQRLSTNIGEVLIFTVIGLGVGLIGIALLCVALFVYRYRAMWLFWFLVIYGGVLLLGYPVGTAIGILFLVYCITHRHEFFKPKEPGNP